VRVEIDNQARKDGPASGDAALLDSATTAQYFWRKVAERGDRIALRRKYRGIWKSISWREYGEAARRAGLGFAALGVARGDVVSILSDGSPEWLFADRGAQAIGAISNAIHTTSDSNAVRAILADGRAGVCLVDNSEQLQKILSVVRDLPALRKLVVVNLDGLHAFRDPMVMAFQDLLKLGDEYAAARPHFWDRELAAGRPDEPAVAAYACSSSSASPRGALLSHSGLMFLVRNQPAIWPQSPDDVQLNLAPLANITERVLAVLLPMKSGVVINFAESPETLDENLQESQPTCLFAPPRHWERIVSRQSVRMAEATSFQRGAYRAAFAVGARMARGVAAGKKPSAFERLAFWIVDLLVLGNVKRQYGLGNVRQALVGSDLLADEIYAWFVALGIELRPLYGLTESSGVAALAWPHAPCAGRLELGLPGAEMKLDANGEILLRGPNVFMGYLNGADEDRFVGEWLRTGDIGEADEEGSVSIVGRLEDRITLESGQTINPARIEARLRASPYIAAAMLIGQGRRALTCLVLPDHETVAHYAQNLNAPFTNFASLCATPEVLELIRREIDKVNKSLPLAEAIEDFRIIDRSFSPDDREIIKGLRFDRPILIESLRSVIDDLYRVVEIGFPEPA
jgi:long-chain acyl-CoA synthetase